MSTRSRGTGAPRGRPPKHPGGRVSVRLALPTPFADAIYREVRDEDVPLTDLGAYYMILGWNDTHPPEEQVDMPAYLTDLMDFSPSPQASLLSA